MRSRTVWRHGNEGYKRSSAVAWETEWSDHYEHEMAAYPILTAQQEYKIGRRIHQGRSVAPLMWALLRYGPTPAHRRYAAWWLARTKVSWDALVNHNLRLAVSFVRKWLSGRTGIGSHGYYDLVQLGNAGLMTAAWRFDYRRGNKFSTMATWWIRQAVTRGADEDANMVHTPVYVTAALRKAKRLVDQYQMEPGHEGATPPDEWLRAHGMTATQVRVFHEAPPLYVTSLDIPLTPSGPHFHDGDAVYIADTLEAPPADGGAEDVEARLAASALVERLRKILEERELQVLLMRSGVAGERLALEECGRRLRVTRERVRQIEAAARRKLFLAGMQTDGSMGAPRTEMEAATLVREATSTPKPRKPAAGEAAS